MSFTKYSSLLHRLEIEKALNSSFTRTPDGVKLLNQMRSIWSLLTEEEQQRVLSNSADKETPFDKDKYE